MHTRLATIDDIPQLVSLGKSLLELHGTWDPPYYQLTQDFDSQFGQFIQQHISHPYQFVIVMEKDTQIVGFVSGFVKSLYPWFTVKSVGHITYLITLPDMRQLGIGEILEEKALQWFKEKNIQYVEVYTDEKNIIGGIVWDKLGYVPFKKFLRKTI